MKSCTALAIASAFVAKGSIAEAMRTETLLGALLPCSGAQRGSSSDAHQGSSSSRTGDGSAMSSCASSREIGTSDEEDSMHALDSG